MSRRRQQSIDHALRVLLRKALEQRPVISDGSPLLPEYAALKLEIPQREAERILDQLVTADIAIKVDNGYLLKELSQ